MYSTYKNKLSIVLETDHLRAEIVPEPGGKMVSLKSKSTGFEYLLQRPSPVYRHQPYGGSYIKGECSGFDDMFPTIDPCLYHMEPWKGVELSDHGEVWSMPWSYQLKNGILQLTVDGVRLPYRIEKKIFCPSEKVVRIVYSLFNKSDYDIDFLWAGHLMINIDPGTKVMVPEDCQEAISVLSNAGRAFGDIIYWPFMIDGDGTIYRADTARPETSKGFEKYYFSNKLNNGWCELAYPDGLKKLRISFSQETVPYLGILMNERGWDDIYNIILEPCTVCFDRPDIANQQGQISRVVANGIYEWFLEIEI